MLCALTVRTLKPDTFDDFHEAFTAGMDDGPPPGWKRLDILRSVENPDEVICFGFFDGSVDELRASASDHGYDSQMERVSQYVSSVGTDGLFEIADERVV